MVQPQPDGPMQWEMSGEESGGVLRVPPELAANEVVTRLLGDNQQLRGRTNDTTCFIFFYNYELLSQVKRVHNNSYNSRQNNSLI